MYNCLLVNNSTNGVLAESIADNERLAGVVKNLTKFFFVPEVIKRIFSSVSFNPERLTSDNRGNPRREE
jgi:hypothetical protein